MTRCVLCGEPATGYGKHFQSRKKVGSYPLCGKHIGTEADRTPSEARPGPAREVPPSEEGDTPAVQGEFQALTDQTRLFFTHLL